MRLGDVLRAGCEAGRLVTVARERAARVSARVAAMAVSAAVAASRAAVFRLRPSPMVLAEVVHGMQHVMEAARWLASVVDEVDDDALVQVLG
jgi:hypothetical protein